MLNDSDRTEFLWRDVGRKLAYIEYGNPLGFPVFYFHGFPGSRLEPEVIEESIRNFSIRLIAIDRPGMGLSDFQENRILLDWPDCVERVADFLKLEKFSVLGVSGGGPYALACAVKIPNRLHSTVVVSGLGPLNKKEIYNSLNRGDRFLFDLSKASRFLARIILKIGFINPEKALKKALKSLPEPDKEVLKDDSIREIVIESMRESIRNGARGLAHEAFIYAMPWGFDLEDLNIPVHIFHGALDTNVRIESGIIQEELIPHAIEHFYQGEGHFSLFVNRISDIMRAI